MSILNDMDCSRARSETVMLLHRLKQIDGPGEPDDLDKTEEYLNECLAQLKRIRNGGEK
jgi:hypothetical protein